MIESDGSHDVMGALQESPRNHLGRVQFGRRDFELRPGIDLLLESVMKKNAT